MTDCKHLRQQTIKTSAQNAVFAQSDGDGRRVEIGLQRVIFVDLESRSMEPITVTYFCHNSLLPVIYHVSSQFIF